MRHIFPKNTVLLTSVFLILAVFWRFTAVDFFLAIPEDFTYSADIESVDNFYNEEKATYNGPQYSETDFSYQVVSSTNEGLEIKNLFDVRTIDGAEIFSTQRLYGIDPKTGAHVQGLGDQDREGFLFAPKELKEGEPYTYWHVNYDGPANMYFVGKENLNGLKVYHYETYYENVEIDQTDSLSHLPGVSEEKGIKVLPHLEVWVEPVTGYLVKYQDESTAYYYDIETGETLTPWNHFYNTYTHESVEVHAAEASILKNKTIFLQSYLPLVFVLLAVFILICGLRRSSTVQKKSRVKPLLTIFMILFPIVGFTSTWYLIGYNFRHETKLQFEERADTIEEAIVNKIEIYIAALQGSSGLFAASQSVEREEWTVYVDHMNLGENYPGVNAVGFAKVVSNDEKEAFIESVRAEGFTNYVIYPEGERSVYAPVLYFQSSVGESVDILGYDLYSEAIREAGVIKARDSGSASMSGKVELHTEEKDKVGFIIYAPIYKNGEAHDTIEQRRAAIYGYAYTRFRASDFIDGIFGDSNLGLDFEIYDGTTINEENLLYRSADAEVETGDAKYTRVETIYLAGNPWTFSFSSGDKFELSLRQKIVTYAALAGGIILIGLYLLTYYFLMIARGKDRKILDGALSK
jgi:CHASE1-domain containing sensor protein